MQDSNSENPTPYSYWVVKNRFLAGEYPGDQNPGNPIRSFFSKFYALLATINRPNKGWHSVQVRCAELINSGVNSFVDYLSHNKRFSSHTVNAYKSDIEQFLLFLNLTNESCF